MKINKGDKLLCRIYNKGMSNIRLICREQVKNQNRYETLLDRFNIRYQRKRTIGVKMGRTRMNTMTLVLTHNGTLMRRLNLSKKLVYNNTLNLSKQIKKRLYNISL